MSSACTYNLAEIGDFHSCLPACLLNILKAVKRDSTIKNINVPCRFSSSFISGVRTALGFEILRIYMMLGREIVRSLAWFVSRSLYLSFYFFALSFLFFQY